MREETCYYHCELLFLISSNGSFICTNPMDSTHNGLCYTSRGALAGTRNSSMCPPWHDRPDYPSHHEQTLYHGATSIMDAPLGMLENVVKTWERCKIKFTLHLIKISVTLLPGPEVRFALRCGCRSPSSPSVSHQLSDTERAHAGTWQTLYRKHKHVSSVLQAELIKS